MSRGNWERMGQAALGNRRGEAFSAMALMMDCSSGASAARRARIRAEARDRANVLGDALDGFYPEDCAPCGNPDLGDAFRSAFRCDVPALFVSGELDARTPPSNAEEIQAGFPNGVHVLVTNASHDSRELESPEYQELLRAFLRGETVKGRTIEMPPVPLMPLR
jgi:pimeloyl-ACP methyl ester carboxylesterase